MSAPRTPLSQTAPIGRIGRYDVLGRLATGGMAEVFLAGVRGPRDVARVVVVKRLLPNIASDSARVEAFVSEARLTSRLSHANLCSVFDFGDDEGTFFLAMEWVRGPSLREVIERVHAAGRAMPVPIVARLFAGLASALHHAHSAIDERGQPLGIVHRDVTPENVIVSWGGVAKLIDFGIAKSSVDHKKTEAGVLKGKFAYISPEQYKGLPLDGRSDVFALGLCMYEALIGERLYERASEYETMAAILLGPEVPSVRERRRDVPEAIDQIVRRSLAKDRAERYPSADAMARDLESWLAQRGEAVSEREIATYLGEQFPGEAALEPKLERKSFEQTIRRRTISQEMETITLGAEADLDADVLERAQRARRRPVIIALALVLLAAVGIIAAVALRERPGQAPATTTTEPR